jgi:hypothetical protein
VNVGDAVQWRNILGCCRVHRGFLLFVLNNGIAGRAPLPRLTAAGEALCKRLQNMARAVDLALFDSWWRCSCCSDAMRRTYVYRLCRSTLRASSIARFLSHFGNSFDLASTVADTSRYLSGACIMRPLTACFHRRTLGGAHAILLSSPAAAPQSAPAGAKTRPQQGLK